MLDPDDHRSLIQQLDLCHFEDESPGMVHWHPRGYLLYRLLEGAARTRTETDGYSEVQLTRSSSDGRCGMLAGTGGASAPACFACTIDSFEAALKPVSCPGHIHAREAGSRLVPRTFHSGFRSSVSSIATSRAARLMAYCGLRQLTQDDGHVFCREDQVDEELDRFCRSVEPFYAAFGFTSIEAAISTRPTRARRRGC